MNLESEEVKHFFYVFSFSFLEEWFHDTVDEMMKWIDHAISHARIRDASITELDSHMNTEKDRADGCLCV